MLKLIYIFFCFKLVMANYVRSKKCWCVITIKQCNIVEYFQLIFEYQTFSNISFLSRYTFIYLYIARDRGNWYLFWSHLGCLFGFSSNYNIVNRNTHFTLSIQCIYVYIVYVHIYIYIYICRCCTCKFFKGLVKHMRWNHRTF